MSRRARTVVARADLVALTGELTVAAAWIDGSAEESKAL
jgi:hypothetical protein